MTRQRHNGIRKICPCDKSVWDSCDHPWHFNFKPRHAKPPAEWLAKPNRKGQPRKARQWPGYRYSLDAFFKRKVRNKAEAEQLADKLRAMIANRHVVKRHKMENDSVVTRPYRERKFAYTYLVSDPPFVKIGRTANIKKRWPAQGVTDNPRTVAVVSVVEHDVESLVHAECEPFHYRGEWFYDVPEVRATFEKIKSAVMQGDSLNKTASTTEKYG